MSEITRLDNEIGTLFDLKKSEFDPKIHLGYATDIVAATRSKVDQSLKLADLFRLNPPLTPEYLHRVGNFLIEGKNRLVGAGLYGFHPKLEITPWRANLMRMPGDSIPKLIISHTGDTVRSVTRLIEHAQLIELGDIALQSHSPEIVWQFRT